jgi:hypothetical protein
LAVAVLAVQQAQLLELVVVVVVLDAVAGALEKTLLLVAAKVVVAQYLFGLGSPINDNMN